MVKFDGSNKAIRVQERELWGYVKNTAGRSTPTPSEAQKAVVPSSVS